MGDIFEKCTAKTHAVNRTFLVFLHSVEDKIKSHTTQRNTEFAGVEFYTSKKFIKYASYVTRRSNLVCLAIGVIPLRGWKHLTIEFDLNGSNYMHSELTFREKTVAKSADSGDMYLSHIFLNTNLPVVLEQQYHLCIVVMVAFGMSIPVMTEFAAVPFIHG
jgi:hypothetical protein